MGELPPKLFFRIGEVAGLVGVEPHVLRYWEREFRSIRPTKSAKGQRVYSRKDVENLLRVRDLLYRDGFTIAGAKKKLQRGDAVEARGLESPTADGLDGQTRHVRTLDLHGAPASALDVRALGMRGAPVSALDVRGAPASALDVRGAPDPLAGDPFPSTSDAPPLEQGAPDVRETLLALRSEVEAFLDELSASGPVARASGPARTNGAGARTEGKR
ncbi:MAG: MerR family transcriptional regulator [Labilithrix sp.]|nr:MerR family transcriptional regulator [Labilithrix sp.]